MRIRRTLSLLGVSMATSLLVGCVPASQVDEDQNTGGAASADEDDDSSVEQDDDSGAEENDDSGDSDSTSGDQNGGAAGSGATASGSTGNVGSDDDSSDGVGGSGGTAGEGETIIGTLGASTSGGAHAGGAGETASGGTEAASGGTEEASGGTEAASGGTEEASGAAGAAGSTSTATGGGGSATGGSGGSGGAVVVTMDTCDGAEPIANDDRDSATPYVLGTDYLGCIQNEDDVDYYEFTVPDDITGGYAVVSTTDVGDTGSIRLEIWSAADNGQIDSAYTYVSGASVYSYFNAAPGSTYRVGVSCSGGSVDAYPYTFNVSYTQVADPYEPNDDRNHAAPISANEPIEAYMFAGWVKSTEIPEEDWYDWYQVELEAGNTSILLSLLASDVSGRFTVYDALGSNVRSAYNYTAGASVLLELELDTAGTYYLRVEPSSNPVSADSTNNVPQYLVMPYTLTVTQ